MTKPYNVTVTVNGETEDINLVLTLKTGSSDQLIGLAAGQHGYQVQVQELDEEGTPVTNADGTAKMINNPVTPLNFLADVTVGFWQESAKAQATKLANEQSSAAAEAQFNSMLS